MRTSNRKQDILYTTLEGNVFNVTINSISLFIPQKLPSPETQGYLNEDISKILHYHMNLGRLTENQLIHLNNFK